MNHAIAKDNFNPELELNFVPSSMGMKLSPPLCTLTPKGMKISPLSTVTPKNIAVV